jgi:hypothetical protein
MDQVGIAIRERHVENVFVRNVEVVDGMQKRIKHAKR